jgi:hypothetical protein
MRHLTTLAAFALAGAGIGGPASARVHEASPDSFVIHQSATVPANPREVWDLLVRPSEWWIKANSFSGDSANLSLHPRAGGCFCEILPDKASPNAAPRGSVEHMRVVYAEDGRALRMVGALGPMQADAVTGVLTIVLKPGDGGTVILWEYAVSGHLRKEGMAAKTDAMLADQIRSLAGKLGGARRTTGGRGALDGAGDARSDADHSGMGAGGAGGDDGESSQEHTGEAVPRLPVVIQPLPVGR